MDRSARARASSRDKVYRGLFFAGVGAFGLLVVIGGARATVVRKLPSIYDAGDVFTRATELEESGDMAGAIRELSAATFIQPQEITGYQRLGFIQAAAGDVAGELATYERGYAQNPLSPRANMTLGLAYLQRARFEEAEARLRQAVSLDPNDAMLHAALGDLLVARNKNDDAIATFQQALALDPGESAIHNKAAIAYAYGGQMERARQHFERAVQLGPNNAEAADNLQRLLSHLKEGTP